MITNAQMTRKERIEARRAYFAKQEKPFGNCSVPLQVHVEYDVTIEPVPGIESKEKNNEATHETPPRRPTTIGERARLLQNSNMHGTTTTTTTTPNMLPPEPQKLDTIYHAISIKNIDGSESREDVYRFIILHCPFKIKLIYVSEIMKHAFVVFFSEENANDMVKRLNRQPFHNYMLEVERIGVASTSTTTRPPTTTTTTPPVSGQHRPGTIDVQPSRGPTTTTETSGYSSSAW